MKKKIFIIIETIIYITFMYADYFNKFDTTILKYFGILLCFIYCLINRKIYGILSFAFTLIADYFLLVRLDNFPLGISSFIVVQIIYANYTKTLTRKYCLLFRVCVPLLLIIIIKPNDLTTTLSLIYFPQLLISAFASIKYTHNTLLSIGLLLFVGCDICVCLHNLDLYNKYYALGQWFFYLPSQVLIALAIKNKV